MGVIWHINNAFVSIIMCDLLEFVILVVNNSFGIELLCCKTEISLPYTSLMMFQLSSFHKHCSSQSFF